MVAMIAKGCVGQNVFQNITKHALSLLENNWVGTWQFIIKEEREECMFVRAFVCVSEIQIDTHTSSE